MKKTLALMLTLVLTLSACSALAAGKLNVVQENYYTVPGYSNYGYVFAKVENSGDKPIKVNAGVLEIYDEAGDVITSEDYMEANAEYLEPGEYTYVEIRAEIEGEEVAADHMLTLTGKSEKDAMCLRLPCESDLQMNVVDGWWRHDYMYATITNNTEEPLYSIETAFALLDAEGNIVYMDEDNLYTDHALMPGSSMIVRKDISSTFIDYFEANNIVPVAVDAFAYVEIELED